MVNYYGGFGGFGYPFLGGFLGGLLGNAIYPGYPYGGGGYGGGYYQPYPHYGGYRPYPGPGRPVRPRPYPGPYPGPRRGW